MKKLLSYLLVIALVLVQFMPLVSAAETTGSITIKTDAQQTKDGEITYNIYKMFDLSLNDNATAYRYTINTSSAWYDFVKEGGDGSSYVTLIPSVDNEYVVTMSLTSNSDEMAAFAKAALAYAKDKKITTPTTTTIAQGGTEATVTGLELGYYLIDSSIGTLVALTSTDRKAEVIEKNTIPTVKKEVQEDSDESYGTSNTAQIGDTVNFKTTITVAKGAVNYVLYDKMDAGLTFNQESLTVKVGNDVVSTNNYSFVEDANYTFVIRFDDEYIASLTASTQIVVEYSALLNENAKVSTESNDNTTHITYGDDNQYTSETKSTKTYTFEFDIVKTNTSDEVLSGAKFRLYDAATDGNEIAVVKVSEGVYRIALANETGVEIEAGHVVIKGLDANTTYYLQETVAPEGYNKLTTRVPVAMKEANLKATVNENKYVSGGIEVENNSGLELPSTGGMGTVMFITVGSIMVLGFGVLLVTKLRISKMEI